MSEVDLRKKHMPTADDRVLISLREVEGAASAHQEQIAAALELRENAMEYVSDVHGLADFMGGRVESLGLREDWAVSKEIFPGVRIFFVFNRADGELPSRLNAMYSGDRTLMRGDDLAAATIVLANHMLRFVKISNPGKDLPDVCLKV